MITWKKDGTEVQDVDVGETLPNEDGTFQKKVVLTVSSEDRKKGQYTCEVAHKSGAPVVKTLVVEDGKNQHLMQLHNFCIKMDHCLVACIVLLFWDW